MWLRSWKASYGLAGSRWHKHKVDVFYHIGKYEHVFQHLISSTNIVSFDQRQSDVSEKCILRSPFMRPSIDSSLFCAQEKIVLGISRLLLVL